MSRTKQALNNMIWAFIGQAIGIIVSFIGRIVFIKTLGSEYLGLNGLFTNILTVLSLAELGIGTAITYSLYKPLAKKDTAQTKVLMDFYKRTYIIIGIVILAIGCAITPFLKFFISEAQDIKNISCIYLLFLINTSISYFYSYKRNLIIADQNRYIATIYRYSCYSIMIIIQTIYLLITKEYFGYLIIQILFTIIENILVSKKADKMYPFLKEKANTKIDENTRKEITKNTKAMIMHKVGGTVVGSTDNILLSSFTGLTTVGIYSNYVLVTDALEIIISQIYNSLIAGIGNLCAKEDTKKIYGVFKKVNFLIFIISSFSSICLMILFNDFISIMAGQEYLFDIKIVFVIVVNFYLSNMRKSVKMFKEVNGLFYKDRYKSIFEAFINIITSIILIKKIGVIGVFIGTFISSITTSVWVEPYVLYKYAFGKTLKDYLKDYFKYILFTVFVGGIIYFICLQIQINLIVNLVLKLIITLTILISSYILVFKNTEEFKFFKELVKNISMNVIGKIKNK